MFIQILAILLTKIFNKELAEKTAQEIYTKFQELVDADEELTYRAKNLAKVCLLERLRSHTPNIPYKSYDVQIKEIIDYAKKIYANADSEKENQEKEIIEQVVEQEKIEVEAPKKARKKVSK